MRGVRHPEADKLIALGWVPLPWFLFWTTIGGLAAPGYSPLSQHASELTLLPGWPDMAVKIAALGSGASFIAFAAGLWMYAGKRPAWGAICWIVFGVSMLSTAFGTWAIPATVSMQSVS